MKLDSYKNDHLFLVEKQLLGCKQILKESCDGLTNHQRYVVEGIYNEFLPLIKQTKLLEQTLTADQIQQLFANIEQGATEAGGNRTMLGKGKDVATKANEIVNNIGKWLQNTTPVKAFDQKFEDLKANIKEKLGGDDSKIVGGLQKLGELAKENPGKTAAIIGILTAIASVAGGPVGGAIAGQVLRGSVELLKGEKLSTAIGKGLKTAAVGWLAGFAMDKIGDMISDVYQSFNPVPIDATNRFFEVNVGNGIPDTFQEASFYGSEQEYETFKEIWADAVREWKSGNFEAARDAFETAKDFAETASINTINQIALEGDPQEKIQLLGQVLDGLAAAAQGAASGAASYDKQGNPVDEKGKPLNADANKPAATPTEALKYNLKPLTEAQVAYLFGKIATTNHDMIAEGVIWEQGQEPEGQKKSLMQKVMGKAGEIGKNLTTKVTASKLMTAWKSAGSPTDSDALADFLKQQGVNDQVVTQTYTGMKLPAPGTAKTTAEIAAIKKEIAMLGPKSAKQLADLLSKQLGAA